MAKKSVIAVEADIELGRQVYDVCHKMGLGVRVSSDSLDALMEAARSKPDLIVFDANTPVLGSLDFADVVSRDSHFKSVALIAIIDEADAVALRQYPARGIAVAAKSKNDRKALRHRLSRILVPLTNCGSSSRGGVQEIPCAKGAA